MREYLKHSGTSLHFFSLSAPSSFGVWKNKTGNYWRYMISCPSLPFSQRIEDCFRWHIHTYHTSHYTQYKDAWLGSLALRAEAECLSLSVSYLVVRRVSFHSCWLRLKFIATHKIEAVTPCKSWIKAALIFDHWRIKGDAETYPSADLSSHYCGKKGLQNVNTRKWRIMLILHWVPSFVHTDFYLQWICFLQIF